MKTSVGVLQITLSSPFAHDEQDRRPRPPALLATKLPPQSTSELVVKRALDKPDVITLGAPDEGEYVAWSFGAR